MRTEFKEPDGWQTGTLINSNAEKLSYGFVARHEKPVKNIIIATGLSEFQQKYFETIRWFDRHGYNVYIMDWYGQGESDRYFADAPDKRHSRGLVRDGDDLLFFRDRVVPDNAPAVILSHSMGALPSLLAIRSFPQMFSGISMIAPFLGFEHPLAKGREAILEKIPVNRYTEKWLGEYIPGGGPWCPRTDPAKKNPPDFFSSDPVRNRLHDQWMTAHPELRIGDVTRRFIREAAVTHMVLRREGVLESIRQPVQIFTAGREKIVSNTAIFNAVSRFPSIHHELVHDASHEILLERDELRLPVLQKIHNFFKSCP